MVKRYCYTCSSAGGGDDNPSSRAACPGYIHNRALQAPNVLQPLIRRVASSNFSHLAPFFIHPHGGPQGRHIQSHFSKKNYLAPNQILNSKKSGAGEPRALSLNQKAQSGNKSAAGDAMKSVRLAAF